MARSILDADLRSWEVFASTSEHGYSPHARVVFYCTTDPARRPRASTRSGDTSDAKALVAGAPAPELAALVARAEPLR